jgi:hypothetical protein
MTVKSTLRCDFALGNISKKTQSSDAEYLRRVQRIPCARCGVDVERQEDRHSQLPALEGSFTRRATRQTMYSMHIQVPGRASIFERNRRAVHTGKSGIW